MKFPLNLLVYMTLFINLKLNLPEKVGAFLQVLLFKTSLQIVAILNNSAMYKMCFYDLKFICLNFFGIFSDSFL